MYYTIYKITNKLNGKTYIGMHKTNDLEDGYMGSGKLISRAIKKHGIENFTKEILNIFDNEQDMKNKEKQLVIVSEETYNLNEGGHGGFGYINKEGKNIYGKNGKSGYGLENLIENTALYMKNIGKYENYCENISSGLKKRFKENGHHWTGRKHKEHTKNIIGKKNSESQKGNKNSQFGTCWITNGKENKKIKKENIDKYIELGYYKGRIKE